MERPSPCLHWLGKPFFCMRPTTKVECHVRIPEPAIRGRTCPSIIPFRSLLRGVILERGVRPQLPRRFSIVSRALKAEGKTECAKLTRAVDINSVMSQSRLLRSNIMSFSSCLSALDDMIVGLVVYCRLNGSHQPREERASAGWLGYV